jgi:3-hydroxymyristoyl/3-hydroxydecanoyl-(acyl carrier protein) dehydratase
MQVDFNFQVSASHPSLAGHFPGNPIVPGVLLLDQVMEGLAAAVGRDVVRIQRVKFSSVLKPEESASAQCVLEGERASFRVSVSRGTIRVLVAEGSGLVTPGAAS